MHKNTFFLLLKHLISLHLGRTARATLQLRHFCSLWRRLLFPATHLFPEKTFFPYFPFLSLIYMYIIYSFLYLKSESRILRTKGGRQKGGCLVPGGAAPAPQHGSSRPAPQNGGGSTHRRLERRRASRRRPRTPLSFVFAIIFLSLLSALEGRCGQNLLHSLSLTRAAAPPPTAAGRRPAVGHSGPGPRGVGFLGAAVAPAMGEGSSSPARSHLLRRVGALGAN